MLFRWYERHRGQEHHRGEEVRREDLDNWDRSVHSAADAIEKWPHDVPHKDWNLRQLEKRRRSIARGERQE